MPASSEVATLAQLAGAAATEAVSILGEAETELLLAQCSVAPDDLLRIVRLMERRDDLVRAPSWLIWPDQDPLFELPEAKKLDLVLLLADPERRHRCQKFLDFLRQIGEPGTVRWLRPPVGGATVEDALQDWFDGTRSFLDSLSPEERAAALADDRLSLAALQEVNTELNAFAARLSADAGNSLRRLVDGAHLTERPALVRALSRRVDDFCRTMKLEALFVTSGMLEQWASQPSEALTVPVIEVQHNWVGLKGARATLTVAQDDPTRDLGYVDAPLALESNEAKEWTLRMRWDVKSDWRADWPVEYPAIEPEQLSISKYQWRRESETEPYQHTFRLRIPVRLSRDKRKRLEVSVFVEDAVSGETLVRDQLLRWDALQFTPVPVSVAWSTAGKPDDIEQHPIGPQAHASAILDRLVSLSCAAVIAPRRFGKTTLVQYLARTLPERGIWAAPPVVCTEHKLSQGIDYGGLWAAVSDALYARFDTGLPGGWSGPLPPDNAFDAVRRAAFKQGFSAIALLLDEAQLFFPSDQGHEIGSRLKTRLERAWCVPRSDMAPLLFCFVGLPPLMGRAGADLIGLLVPTVARDMTEEELRPLIASKVPSLQTTKAFRAELARTARNLFVLRVLLNRTADRVTRERRLWASVDDLTHASRALAHDLRDGREESVGAYMRDVLNESDDVNVWRPMVCVPTAAAIAEVRHAATSFDDLLQRAAQRLNEWSRASFAETRSGPTYDRETVARHFSRLEELKVVQHSGEFQSPYLDAWLAGLARRWMADDEFRAALFSGGQRRIRVPLGAPVHQTPHTRIIRAEDPHGALAFRVRRLLDESDRAVFLESVEMFDSLRSAANRGENGSAFIFRLEDVGLSGTDSKEAVQVYRWVDGEDLRSKIGSLAAEHVLDIGIKLSRALTLLHRRGILHRDIQPGNIIIDEGEHASNDLRPVLIDFGFARVLGRTMHTRLAGDFAAPEVCTDQPQWSRAADVYSLCATLRAVLNPASDVAAPIDEVMKVGLATAHAKRPSAEALTERFQALAHQLQVQERRDSAWAAVRARLGAGAYVPELSATVNRHRTVLELLELGSYRTVEERHRVIADVVNQCAERRTGSGLKGITVATQSSAVAVLHALRVLHVHPDTVLSHDHKKALASYRCGQPAHQMAIVREALTTVSSYLKIPALADVLEAYA
jgi:hypothetical protein